MIFFNLSPIKVGGSRTQHSAKWNRNSKYMSHYQWLWLQVFPHDNDVLLRKVAHKKVQQALSVVNWSN